jgi:hypothetical protein
MTSFMGRRDRREQRGDPRLPPGQYDTGDSFPVLTAEVTPQVDPQAWTFRVDGLVAPLGPGRGRRCMSSRRRRTRGTSTV